VSKVTPATRHMTGSALVIARRLPDPPRVLLVHHRASGLWQFPGGHVEDNESPLEAALRETQEETGVFALATQVGQQGPRGLPGMKVEPSPLVVATIPAPAKPHKGEPAHTHIDFLYLCTAVATEGNRNQPSTDEGVARFAWVDASEVRNWVGVRAEVPELVSRATELLGTVSR
jgi:8-oxo-dGTP pyrophosphatase MutT (NUDIX family)